MNKVHIASQRTTLLALVAVHELCYLNWLILCQQNIRDRHNQRGKAVQKLVTILVYFPKWLSFMKTSTEYS